LRWQGHRGLLVRGEFEQLPRFRYPARLRLGPTFRGAATACTNSASGAVANRSRPV
jgi:hypothetical protein